MYAFVTPENYIWLWFLIRLIQHVLGVIVNAVTASMLYVNLPDKDRTNYIAFYSIVVNMSIFLSMMFGTFFLSVMGENTLNFFGFQMAAVPILLAVSGIMQIAVGLLSRKLNDKLLPDELLRR